MLLPPTAGGKVFEESILPGLRYGMGAFVFQLSILFSFIPMWKLPTGECL
jgi:hypothetical protein